MDLYNKVVEYVDFSFKSKKPHFERAVYWIEQLLPEATEAHKIAAYSHDIERAFRDESKNIPEDYLDIKFLENHQERGAKIIFDFLKNQNAPGETIEKVVHLVISHEIGGDYEQNIMMDADSISFFETNAEMFVTERAKMQDKNKVKAKLDWMFDRISTDDHKNIARDNYERWSKELERI